MLVERDFCLQVSCRAGDFQNLTETKAVVLDPLSSPELEDRSRLEVHICNSFLDRLRSSDRCRCRWSDRLRRWALRRLLRSSHNFRTGSLTILIARLGRTFLFPKAERLPPDLALFPFL